MRTYTRIKEQCRYENVIEKSFIAPYFQEFPFEYFKDTQRLEKDFNITIKNVFLDLPYDSNLIYSIEYVSDIESTSINFDEYFKGRFRMEERERKINKLLL